MSNDRQTGIRGEGERMGRERDAGRRVLGMNGGRQGGWEAGGKRCRLR